MKVSFEGIGETVVTLHSAGNTAGMCVKLSTNKTAAACAAGERIAGLSLADKGGFACVQLGGAVTVPYTGTAPAVGFAALVADGNGGVKTAENGGEYLVLDVDSTAKTVTFIL